MLKYSTEVSEDIVPPGRHQAVSCVLLNANSEPGLVNADI